MPPEAFTEDVRLWEKCIAGNKEAWDTLVKKYSKLVYKTIWDTLKQYPNPGGIDANDVYQDVFIKILEKLHQWSRLAPLLAWIRAIAFSTTIDHLRRRIFIPLETDERTENPDPIPRIFVTELRQYLTPEDWYLVNLFFIEEWPPEDIAQTLRKGIGTIYTMKSRLLDKIRTICQRHGLL